MSGLCIFHLKDFHLDFQSMEKLSFQLMRIALKNHVALFFDRNDYGEALIKSAHMNHYFLLSDSFLYRNCNLLDTSFWKDVSKKKSCQRAFYKKYRFFRKIVKEIMKFDGNHVELYLSNDASSDNPDDFICITSNEKGFLKELFNCIYGNAGAYAYGFLSVKIDLYKDDESSC